MSESKIRTIKFGKALFVATAVIIIIVWAASGYLIHNYSRLILKDAQPGTFGDMFGAVNALFSGLAFACLIFATLMQRRELSLQREELKLAREEAAKTRSEIAGQREQATIQNEGFKRQRFENTFFEMLKLHHQIVQSLENRDFHQSWACGRMMLIASFNTLQSEPNDPSKYNSIKGPLNQYFKNCQQIFKLIDTENGTKTADKEKYINIVLAQLSNAEISLLFYHCFWNEDDGFKKLAISMKIFDNLPTAGLLDVAHREQFFNSNELKTPDK